jgi:hypothetical protein
VREKLATFRRPRKFKTSENDFSHGSFFLRIGGIGETLSGYLHTREYIVIKDTSLCNFVYDLM